ncbi:MAG: TIGR04066 family peptide maturation system protein [Lachnospiraceae bacterium]|nr:TIGR04066 family peptide maturation system protein [Lachnospiraceae bacterium]
MKKKRALLFPYDTSLLHMVTNSNMMLKYEIVNVVSLKSWGYCGEDVGAKLGLNIGMTVQDDFEKALEGVSTVIIADTNIHLDYELMNLYISKAIGDGKEILDIRCLSEKCDSTVDEKMMHLDTDPKNVPQLKDINKPIVMIVGTGENTGKFDAQMYVREAFISGGYKVSQIGSKSYCELWGFHSFPQFMSGEKKGTKEIVRFNHYVNRIVTSEDSDVVIIGVPGGVAPISDKVYDDFGLTNYMIAQAVNPDYVILNMGFVHYSKQYIEAMIKVLKCRLGYDVDSVFLSNSFINWEVTDSLDRLVYTTMPMDITKCESKACGCYALHDKEDIGIFKKQMLSTLVDYNVYNAI